MRAAGRPSQLKRFVLFAEMTVPRRAEERHDLAILQTLTVCRDELERVDLGVPFRIEVRLTVVGYEARGAWPSTLVRDALNLRFCVLTYVAGCLYFQRRR